MIPACFNRIVATGFLLAMAFPVTLYAENYEPRLIDSLNALQYEPENVSEVKIAALIKDFPNSQTAHLMMADLLAARAGVTNPNDLRANFQEPSALRQLDGLREEVRLRWNQTTVISPAEKGLVPASIIQLAPIRKTAVVVDAENARIYTYKNIDGKLSMLTNNYTTIGKQGSHKRLEGDERTPIGVYHVTRYIDDKELPPLYGSGAFPINYPNELDKRYGRTGYGIWLHGTFPESYNRIPLASDGCVVMSNPEFDSLKPLIDPKAKTAVVISDQINWIRPENLDAARNLFNNLLDQWVKDWESLDPERFLSHYDKNDFQNADYDYDEWARHKTAVHIGKTRINVDLGNVSLFAYPGERDMILAEFTQRYQSNNFDSQSDKRQYWKRDGQGDWKIIYEGSQ